MKKIIITIIGFITLSFAICRIPVNAQEVQEGSEIVESEDNLEDTFEYYFQLVSTYVVGLGGTISGLLLIFKKILNIAKEVKEGTKSIEEAKNELNIQKEELEKYKNEFIDYTNTFKEAILDEERLNDVATKIDKIVAVLNEISSNDSKLISNGVASKVKDILEGDVKDV